MKSIDAENNFKNKSSINDIFKLGHHSKVKQQFKRKSFKNVNIFSKIYLCFFLYSQGGGMAVTLYGSKIFWKKTFEKIKIIKKNNNKNNKKTK